MTPTATTEVPSTVTMYSGSRAWIISEEMSMNIDTKPSAQTLRGIFGKALLVAGGAVFSTLGIVEPRLYRYVRNCRSLGAGCKSDEWATSTWKDVVNCI
ncbi:hypothetical protein KU43P_36630 [Pseudomonas sp. KU43P]|nr:hypothetical protein KU43P_36630 [Pseudomonas sp. KU43P]